MRPWLPLLAVLLLAAGCTSAPEAPTEAQRDDAVAAVEEYGPDAWGLGDALAAASADVCQEGQENYKVDEVGFACTVGRSWVLPAARTDADVTAAIDAMSAAVDELGCEPVGSKDWLAEARRYWVEKVQAEPGRLPSGRFTCDDVTVEIGTLSAAVPDLTRIEGVATLTGGDVGTPDVEDYPADAEQQVRDTGAAMLWEVVASTRYATQD